MPNGLGGPTAHAILELASATAAGAVVRTDGRGVEKGIREREELAPAFVDGLRRAYEESGLAEVQVEADRVLSGLANWSRPASEIDVVVTRESGEVDLAGELKAWDIDHQLFDLLKVCCLLDGPARAGFLGCVARRSEDFKLRPGGELFARQDAETRVHSIPELLARHGKEFSRHVGWGGPEPTAVPTAVRTVAIGDPQPIDSYPGHELRACVVELVNADRVPLTEVVR
ncbi:hypothetical protein HJD18_09820 [Thermoleophilia bacterium SCSIO 60948]|nr:hypothetical protein HJD18_09820 [Thermoleophilia bacterium SCSIO 60948]